MGCRSSAPLHVVERPPRQDEFFGGNGGGGGGGDNNDIDAGLEVLTLADLAAFEDRLFIGRRGRRNRSREQRMADIAALQQGLSMMENIFTNLIGESAFFTEAMDPNNDGQGLIGPPPASDAAIASLPKSNLTQKELSLLNNKTCIVCCEVLDVNTEVTRLPCGHVYHPNCVEPWLHRHCTCPACRYELPTDDSDFEEGRMERMKTRKLPNHNHDDQDNGDAPDEQSQPDVTWDETSTTSGGDGNPYRWWGQQFLTEGRHVWLVDEDGVAVDPPPREEDTWMIRLIEENEDRPASTLPAAMERLNSSGDVREESPDGQGEPTPKHSNASFRRLDGHNEDPFATDELIAANDTEEWSPKD